MIHLEDHDPIEFHEQCETCNYLLRRAFNDVLPGLELGPAGASQLIERIREVAAELNAKEGRDDRALDQGAAS